MMRFPATITAASLRGAVAGLGAAIAIGAMEWFSLAAVIRRVR
ncbi:MAG TPA: hypothetical protein VE267_04020 [Bradyrhizobium sp.]|nr:hypothetical protein [Bradyrhizobium sp.]